MNLATKEYVDDKGGELKAKTWVCAGLQDGAECSFNQLKNQFDAGIQPDIENMYYYSNTKAIIKFIEEKSLVEVNKWLIFEAKMSIYGDYTIANDIVIFTDYTPFAMCPWPEDKPWPGSN